jgi:hypothetical protein
MGHFSIRPLSKDRQCKCNERCKARNGYANGYANGLKDRGFHSSVGPLPLRVPQPRDGDEPYRPST